MTNDILESLPTIEVYRSTELTGSCVNASIFRQIVKAVELCGHLPVVVRRGDETVLYAIKSSAIRKEKVRKSLKKVESA